jgi:glycosyltransferase involved in cell wall biosynthesis
MTADLSVVIAVRDGEQRLPRAIQSLLSADGLLEIVVVDDGSSDASADVAASFGEPVRVVRQPPSGVAAARNAGVAASQGAIISFIDDDDEWLAGAVDPRRALLAAEPGAIALGRTVIVGQEKPFVLESFCAALIPRAVWEYVGAVDETLRVGEDLAWFLAARDAGVPIQTVPDVVLRYHRRAGSLSSQPGQGLLAGLHHAIARRNLAG